MNRMLYNELDIVKIIKLLKSDRSYTGTQSVTRSPQIGDVGTIVSVLNNGVSEVLYSVECLDKNGFTVWLADFSYEEILRFTPDRRRYRKEENK